MNMEETETLNSEIVMERAESIGGTSFLGAEITDVFWERINLFMDVCVSFDSELSDDTELEFFAVNRSGRAGARLHVVKKSGNKYRISMNITNVGDCSPIAAGNRRVLRQKLPRLLPSFRRADGKAQKRFTLVFIQKQNGFLHR